MENRSKLGGMPLPTKLSPNLWLAAYALLMPLALGVVANWKGLRDLQNAPAWIQAVGSVAAIIAAIVIDQGASRRQRQMKVQEDRQNDRNRRAAVVAALEALTSARDYLDRQAKIASDHGVVYATQKQILQEARLLQRTGHLAKHYLTVGSGSAKIMAAIAVVVPEVDAAAAILLSFAEDRSQQQLVAAQHRVDDASDAVDEALRTT